MIEVTNAQIRQLRNEAGEAGDSAQIELCDRALEGDAEAREACAEVIENALAMDDSPEGRERWRKAHAQ